jgi:cation diffusion facilitator CzcD-associated flavoprotein CzcO
MSKTIERRVAIIGGGDAGISVAARLRRAVSSTLPSSTRESEPP